MENIFSFYTVAKPCMLGKIFGLSDPFERMWQAFLQCAIMHATSRLFELISKGLMN